METSVAYSVATGLMPVPEVGLVLDRREVTPSIWQMITSMAPVFHKSRLFGVASEEQAAAIMLKGYEMGLGITASFEFIDVIQGKPGLKPRGALALLQNHPAIEFIRIERLVDAKGVYVGHACTMKRNNGFEYTAKWTLEDAKRAGLIKPGGGWESYPENMCLWRCVGFAADVVAPDITGGMTAFLKMPEQFNATINDAGEFIEGKSHPVATESASPLDTLLAFYTPDEIMASNGGRIPTTDAEVEAVAAILAGVA